MAEHVMKYFPSGRTRPHYALVNWKPIFMAYLVRKFVFHPFSMQDAESFFKHYMSQNALRLRIRRLHKSGWLTRSLNGKSEIRPNRKIYLYNFTTGAKKYRAYNGPFDSERGPLIKKIVRNAPH